MSFEKKVSSKSWRYRRPELAQKFWETYPRAYGRGGTPFITILIAIDILCFFFYLKYFRLNQKVEVLQKKTKKVRS